MSKSFETRLEALERTGSSGLDLSSFLQVLREARERAAAGNGPPETPVASQLMGRPVHGEFHRRLFDARERARRLR